MPDLLEAYADDAMMAQEERDDCLPRAFVDEVEESLRQFGGRVAQTGLPSMGKPSGRILVWIANVRPQNREDALLALEDAGLWDRHSGFQI